MIDLQPRIYVIDIINQAAKDKARYRLRCVHGRFQLDFDNDLYDERIEV